MRIQLISDLHLEFSFLRDHLEENPIEVVGDVLVLAGDICTHQKREILQPFLDKWSKSYQKIIYVYGNHEYYKSNYSGETFFLKETGNLIELNNSVYEYQGVRFIGSTMWSGISLESSFNMLDYYEIRHFSQKKENEIHKQSVKYLEKVLRSNYEGPTVVVSHHLPLKECVDELYKNSGINDGFYSDQKHLFDNKIDYWLHGHSHRFQEIEYNGTKIIRNPKGYQRELNKNGFRKDYWIEV